jgi:hypothetical protein
MSAPRWFCNFQPYGAAILDFFSFFLSTTADPTKQAVGNLNSSSSAKGQHEFHLHSTGFQTQDLFQGLRVPEWAITSEPSSPVGWSFIFLVITDSIKINIDFEWKLDFHTNMYRVDRLVSEQLRTQRLNCHTLFLWF